MRTDHGVRCVPVISDGLMDTLDKLADCNVGAAGDRAEADGTRAVPIQQQGPCRLPLLGS